jgi:hypothetical protein
VKQIGGYETLFQEDVTKLVQNSLTTKKKLMQQKCGYATIKI